MIHVTIFQNKYKECVGFQTEGQAEYANPDRILYVPLLLFW